MPDVDFGYATSLLIDSWFANGRLSQLAVKRHLKDYTANSMACYNDSSQVVTYDPKKQITVVRFEPIADPDIDKLVIIYVKAFAYPDVMRDIDDRLRAIGLSVRGLLELPEKTIDLTFFPIDYGSKTQRTPQIQRPCWVNV